MSNTKFLSDPSKRFVVVDNPPSLPGHCALFRTADDEWYIDTRMNDQNLPGHRGAVYIGKRAFDEMAGLVNYLSPEQHEKLSAYAVEAEQRVHSLESELAKWKQVFDELDRIGLLGDAMRNRLNELLGGGVETLPTAELRTEPVVSPVAALDESSGESGPDDTASSEPAKRGSRKPKSTGAF